MPRRKLGAQPVRTAKADVNQVVGELKPEVSRQQAFDRIVNMLTEFFDASVLTVTWVENGKTFHLSQDTGNQFAVTGLVEDLAMDHSDFGGGGGDDDDDDDYRGKAPA